MESSSQIFTSPSFNTHPSTDITDRVVNQLRIQNRFGDDDIFSFNDVDNPAHIVDDSKVNTNNHTDLVNHKEDEDDEYEFEFPVVCRDSNSSPDVISDDQNLISLRYPVFDRSLLLEADLNFPATDSKPAPEAATRPTLWKLLREARDFPSTSSSEVNDLNGIIPGSYCVWKPNAVPRGKHKHKKSNSISIGNTSKRWKVQNLLKRSYSDDNYSASKDSPVVVFIPPISPDRKMNNENVNKIEKTGETGSAMDGGVVFTKSEKKIPAYKSKIGNIRLPPYLPYRQDQKPSCFKENRLQSQQLHRSLGCKVTERSTSLGCKVTERSTSLGCKATEPSIKTGKFGHRHVNTTQNDTKLTSFVSLTDRHVKI